MMVGHGDEYGSGGVMLESQASQGGGVAGRWCVAEENSHGLWVLRDGGMAGLGLGKGRCREDAGVCGEHNKVVG